MNYRIETCLGMIHAEVHPTMEALGDQPWTVRLRDTKGVLLLSCTVEDCSALGAASEAVDTFLECKKVPKGQRSISIA